MENKKRKSSSLLGKFFRHYKMTRTSSLILYACSGLHISGGTILGTSTACALIKFMYLFWTSDLGVELTCGVLVMAGALLCLPLCWICTLVPYNRKSTPLITAGISFSLASLVLLSAGLSSTASLTKTLRHSSALNASMHQAMARSTYDLTTRGALNTMQIDMQCCGVNSYTDWYSYRNNLPASCCGKTCGHDSTKTVLKSSKFAVAKDDECKSPLYSSGCLNVAALHLKAFASNLAFLTCIIIIVVTVSLFTLCYILASESMDANSGRIKAVAVHLPAHSSITAPFLLADGDSAKGITTSVV